MSEILVEMTRGPLAESVHRGDVAVVDSEGRLLYLAGDPGRKRTYWRSSAKPFQAMPVVYTGAADRWGFGPEEIALICASHNGESVHTERVAAMLQRMGLGQEALRCGAHAPYDPETARELRRLGVRPSSLHSNCSGKHTGMLALSLHLGADPGDYLAPEHPVQQEILANVARMTGLDPGQIVLAVDGCGVPCFGLSIYQMALAFARLAAPKTVAEPYGEAARRVRDAMMAHPYLVAGRQRLCTDLMGLTGDLLVAKSGASGVHCLGLRPEAVSALPALAGISPGAGVGVAVKLEDGGGLGSREVAVLEVLRQLGVLSSHQLDSLHSYARPVIRNVAGLAVGEGRPAFVLQQAGA